MVPKKFKSMYIKEISTKSGLSKAKPWTLMPIAIIVPMLDIDNILSKGVGPLIARTKHNATETPKTVNVAKKIIYLNL